VQTTSDRNDTDLELFDVSIVTTPPT